MRSQVRFFDRLYSRRLEAKKREKTRIERFFWQIDGAYLEGEVRRFSLGMKGGGRILEVACGDGKFTPLLCREGVKVLGIDLSEESINLAQKRGIDARFEVMDATHLRFDNEFDGVVCINLLHHLGSKQDIKRVVEGMSRALKPRGKLLLVDMPKSNPMAVLMRKLWRVAPLRVKEMASEEDLVVNGEIPKKLDFKLSELRQWLEKTGFKITGEENRNLVIGYINYLCMAFPFMEKMFPDWLLKVLYRLEREIIEKTPLSVFCDLVMIWAVKE